MNLKNFTIGAGDTQETITSGASLALPLQYRGYTYITAECCAPALKTACKGTVEIYRMLQGSDPIFRSSTSGLPTDYVSVARTRLTRYQLFIFG